MRRAINIALVLGSIFVNVTASPNKTIAKTEARMMQFHNVIWVSGLHIVLPEDMKNFPVELAAECGRDRPIEICTQLRANCIDGTDNENRNPRSNQSIFD